MSNSAAISIIKQHIPSITDEMDEDDVLTPRWDDGDYAGDQRVCACGREIDGYYDYVDHLAEVLSK